MVAKIAYSRQEAADVLGVHVNTIDAWIRERAMPHAKLGGRVIISRDRLEQWLSQNSTVANSEESN